MRTYLLTAVASLLLFASADAADLIYKERLLDDLVKQVPGILKTFNPETGTFGRGIWNCRDQNAMYPLAVAYATEGKNNPYYHDPELLEVIAKSADPLIDAMNDQGQWVFRKKDGSTWGNIWMPWTYSRWARTFGLIRDRLSAEDRDRWAKVLTLGFTGISRTQLGRVHNIPTHHAMGLYAAGRALDRPEWCRQAADFMVKVVEHQSEGGYWSENAGPVVAYNFVYVDALGTYYAMSGDERVLPALEKAALFHRNFTYPGGQNVETIDQRNPYKRSISAGNVGFTFTPAGRSYLDNQWSRLPDGTLSPDLAASIILYGEEGPLEELAPPGFSSKFVMTEGGHDRAATARSGPWFVCLSAYTAPIPKSRWIQDRQNMVSVYHDKVGLVLGGGNTKLQPAWSNFTVGDISLLKHEPGDTSPDFLPKGKLYHVPKLAQLIHQDSLGLELVYGSEKCSIRVHFVDDRTLSYWVATTTTSDLPIAAHLTLYPHLDQPLVTGSGEKVTIGTVPIELSPDQVAGQIEYSGYKLSLPPTASLHWPALPHNPYRKDGRATAGEGRIEVRIPLDSKHPEAEVMIEIVQ
jgi:hypothetical protein